MSRVTVDVVGVRVDVSTDHDAVRGLDGLMVDAPGDCTVESSGTDLESVLADVVLAAVDVAPSLLIHAGAVAREGRAVLLPGESGTGKSTTTAACVRQGLEYVTDEMVAVDLGSGVMSGFARPLMLTAWASEALGIDPAPSNGHIGKFPVSVSRLGGTVATGPLAAAHVVEIRVGAEKATLTRLTAGTTLALLLRSSFNHFRHGHAAWLAASTLAENAAGWRLDVADPASAAVVVDELLRAET